MTMIELAEKILSLIPQSKSKIVFRELPQDDPKQRRADNRLAKKILDWQPMVEPDE
jgi:UDP-glucuronate decarboxylase